MKFRSLLLLCMLTLSFTQAMATIVDGVRQKPTCATMDFVAGTEVYLYNVGAGLFFSQGNSYGTQASLSQEGRRVKFTVNTSSDYTFNDYCTDYSGSNWAWRNVFYASETQMYVDRNNQSDYFFTIIKNGDGTFRISSSVNDPTYDLYAGSFFIGIKSNSSSTALDPFLDPTEEACYVDWAMVTEENYNAIRTELEIYYKAQELKAWIDKINNQNGDASSLSNVYLNETSTLSELQAAIDSALPLYITAVINNAPDKENVDVTLALTNPDFENGETGWTVKATAGSGANGRAGNVRPGGSSSNQCYEAWNNSAFDIYQSLQGMPVGVYEIEVQGFYRYGRDNVAWNAYLAQNVDYVKPEGVPVYVYLNNNATNFVNVYGDKKQITNSSFYSGSSDYTSQTKDGTTYYFPNGMASAAIAFTDGMYKQSAYGLIAAEGDDFRIGVKGNSSQLGDSWVIWDNFKLYYRGFKAEVVQPVLETAMTDLQQYAGLLMGKSAFSALNNALTAAQTAIENQDGEAMFAALNNIYNVKETVIASKDLFLAEEVATSLSNLQEAIAGVAESKLSAAVRTAASTLATGIAGNTIYEDTEIAQLKSDVSSAISAINNSVQVYANLNTAIANLSEKLTAKAYQETIAEATEMVETSTTGYNNGTYTDEDAKTQIANLEEELTKLNASIAKYTSLAAKITELEDAIEETNAEDVHVSASTLKKANLRLTQTQTQYDEGSIANDLIEARMEAIDQVINNLTTSIQLYNSFKEAIANLKKELDKENKVSATTHENAQTLYNDAVTAFDKGTIDDESIEAEITSINTAISNLLASAAKYAELAEAIPTLEEAVTRKAAQSLLDEGNTLLTEVQTGYEEGTIENADVDGKIETINTTCQKIYASEELYTQLAASIDDLEEAIALAQSETTRVSASTLKRANLRLTQTQTQYDAGTIADDQIEGRIENINQLITDLTSSVQLYIDFGDAIAKLKTELDKEKKVSSSTLVAAQTLYNTATEAYNEGTIDDESIEAEITSINTAISNLQASATKYTSLYSAIGALKNTIDNNSTAKMSETTRENAQTLYENTLQAYEDGSLNDSQVDGKVTELNEMGTSVTASVALYTQLAESNSTLSNVIGEAKSKKVSKDLTNNAEQLNSTTASQYSDGSISDADATARITEINEMVNSLQTAIDNIPAFITGKFPSSGLATLATAYDLDFLSATGIEEAYVVSSVVNSSAKLTQVTEIPANSGVILKGQANAEYSIPVIFTATEQAQNLLKAAVEATAVGPNQVYILQGGSFHLVTKASTVPAGKAYLPVVDSENPARSISMYIDGKITGISTTSAADNLEDGKYLKNGKIFIVKNGKKINLDGIQVK